MEREKFDLIVIGAGPAGLTAGLYGSRLGVKTAIFEKLSPGGAITLSSEIENYPGVCEVKDGLSFMECWSEQATRFGAQLKLEEVLELKKEGDLFLVKTSGGEYQSIAVIVATGSTHRKAGFKGEQEFTGRGVSYCAVCDGFFYKGKPVAVVGGGDTALEEALYLSKIAEKVYLIHRRDRFRAAPATQKRVFNTPNIQILWNTRVKEVRGGQFVEELILEREGREEILKVPGIFVFVGMNPNTKLVEGLAELDSNRQLKVNLRMESSLPGLYGAGDIRSESVRQVVAAAGDGAVAAINSVKYIENYRGE
ncbi:MAG: thioredoxin-disulfide reductase [Campylobacterales bacterium]